MLVLLSPPEVQDKVRTDLKILRKRRKLTQLNLARKSGVALGTLRRFEQTGEISLESFIKLSFALGLGLKLSRLFEAEAKAPLTIEDVLKEEPSE